MLKMVNMSDIIPAKHKLAALSLSVKISLYNLEHLSCMWIISTKPVFKSEPFMTSHLQFQLNTNLSSEKTARCPQVSCPRSPSNQRAPCPTLASPLLVLFLFQTSEKGNITWRDTSHFITVISSTFQWEHLHTGLTQVLYKKSTQNSSNMLICRSVNT